MKLFYGFFICDNRHLIERLTLSFLDIFHKFNPN